MIEAAITTGIIFIILSAVYLWGFTHLPHEQWQFFAAIPVRKKGEKWKGVNLTWYGIISASSVSFGALIFIMLLTAAGLPLLSSSLFIAAVLAAAIPSSKIIASLVEKKKHTISVGAALFVGILVSVPVLTGINMLCARLGQPELPFYPVMAASAAAYSFSEGTGRLACLSFGCCYGRKVSSLTGIAGSIFRRWNVRFTGKTKKVSYASDWEGKRLIPVQMITSIIYGINALSGTFLFLTAQYRLAFVSTILVTLIWRILSEFMRSDFRGTMKLFSVYSIMSAAAAFFCIILAILHTGSWGTAPEIIKGIRGLWTPGILLGIQGLWIAVFLYMGRSSVTGSDISFYVHRNKI
jgi:hypothetical protein